MTIKKYQLEIEVDVETLEETHYNFHEDESKVPLEEMVKRGIENDNKCSMGVTSIKEIK